MPDTSFYTVAKKPPIAWVHLNRPDKKNAMNPPAWHEAPPLFEDLDQDPDIRVVILAAHGSCFSVGIDLVEMAGELPEIMEKEQMGGVKWRLLKRIGALQETMSCIERCRKPVIAAIHRHCIGGGVDMICACDIRLATSDAVFSIRETRMGIIADVGTLQRLPHIIGQGWFRELALTGRDFGAREALQIGLVTRICDDRPALYDEAKQLAAQIIACPPLTVQGTKEVINYSRDNGIEAGLQYVAQKNAAALPSEDLMEAVRAFMEKREPVFKGK